MNLEPIPIGTPRPQKRAEVAPIRAKRTLLGRVTWTWRRTFGLGVVAGVVAALAAGLPFVQARENEWRNRLQELTGPRQANPPAVPRR